MKSANYCVIARYSSKYGYILYCAKVSSSEAASDIDLDNVYINTFYYKSSDVPSVGDVVTLSYIKSETGLLYAFKS